jgi:hypothetical protein
MPDDDIQDSLTILRALKSLGEYLNLSAVGAIKALPMNIAS